MIECGWLAVGGAVGAMAAASGLTRILVALAPVDVPHLEHVSMNGAVELMATATLAVCATLISGLWPALFVGRIDPGRVLASGARTAMQPRERLLQRIAVGAQIAVAVVLLSGAALFVRSVRYLQQTPLGFDPRGLVSVELQPSALGLERRDQFYATLLERLAQLPSVAQAGAVVLPPLQGPIGYDAIPVLEGQEGLGPDAAWRLNPRANLQAVTPGYFRAVGARLLAGRDFTHADVSAAENVVIVGASTALRLWPGVTPIGRRVLVPTQRQPGGLETPRWQTVIGVVEDIRYRGLTDPRLDVYLPAAQSTIPVAHVMVRAAQSLSSAVADVSAIARELDRGVLVGEIMSMTDAVSREMAPWRFAMHVLAAFGTLAGGLAALAMVGLLSLVVTLGRRELGIRAALGATPARLGAHVLREAGWIGSLSAAVGALFTAALGRWLSPLLVGTNPSDSLSIATATTGALLLALAACLLPARRAAHLDPLEAIRDR
ncbi:MAG: ABC transporter permease [Vicinamibacterales bacterium]